MKNMRTKRTNREREALEDYRQRVIEELLDQGDHFRALARRLLGVPVRDVYVHGSVLDPERFSEDSDIDLAIVVFDERRPIGLDVDLSRKLFGKFFLGSSALDVIVFNREIPPHDGRRRMGVSNFLRIANPNNPSLKLTESLREIGAEARQRVLECEMDVEAMCLPWSTLAARLFREHGYQPTLIQGVYEVDEPDLDEEGNERFRLPHYWLEVERLIVDGTASQFGDMIHGEVAEVEVGTYSELFRYTPVHRGTPVAWDRIFAKLHRIANPDLEVRTSVLHMDVIGADEHVYAIVASSPDGRTRYGAMQVHVLDEEAHVGYVEVLTTYRRRGVGIALYQALYDWADAEGLMVRHGMLTPAGAATLEAFRGHRRMK